MPLIIFVGISSLGAVFLIVFFAELCYPRHGGSGKSLTTPLLPLAVSDRKKPNAVVVLRRTIDYREPGRPTHVPGQRTRSQVR